MHLGCHGLLPVGPRWAYVKKNLERYRVKRGSAREDIFIYGK